MPQPQPPRHTPTPLPRPPWLSRLSSTLAQSSGSSSHPTSSQLLPSAPVDLNRPSPSMLPLSQPPQYQPDTTATPPLLPPRSPRRSPAPVPSSQPVPPPKLSPEVHPLSKLEVLLPWLLVSPPSCCKCKREGEKRSWCEEGWIELKSMDLAHICILLSC